MGPLDPELRRMNLDPWAARVSAPSPSRGRRCPRRLRAAPNGQRPSRLTSLPVGPPSAPRVNSTPSRRRPEDLVLRARSPPWPSRLKTCPSRLRNPCLGDDPALPKPQQAPRPRIGSEYVVPVSAPRPVSFAIEGSVLHIERRPLMAAPDARDQSAILRVSQDHMHSPWPAELAYPDLARGAVSPRTVVDAAWGSIPRIPSSDPTPDTTTNAAPNPAPVLEASRPPVGPASKPPTHLASAAGKNCPEAAWRQHRVTGLARENGSIGGFLRGSVSGGEDGS